jgi:sugar lactone lactonase YvrE
MTRLTQRLTQRPTPRALRAACCALVCACNARQSDVRTAYADTVATGADSVVTGVSSSEAHFVGNITGFQDPESVRYDPEQDVFFVSNMTGNGSDKDGNGYITRVATTSPYGASLFAVGGKDGVTLNAPKGMTIHGDTLWVCDIDVLRGFERHSGKPIATIDFAPQHAVLLNDVAVGADGTLRVTDTGILMTLQGVIHTGPDRIFEVGPGGAVREVANSLDLRQPNGVTWDASAKRWVVVSFDPFAGEVATMDASGSARRVIHQSKSGNFDGVEAMPGGAILYTSWADSSVHVLRGADDRQLVREVPEPADIGVDTRRWRLAIPLSTLGRVQLWALDSSVVGRR